LLSPLTGEHPDKSDGDDGSDGSARGRSDSVRVRILQPFGDSPIALAALLAALPMRSLTVSAEGLALTE